MHSFNELNQKISALNQTNSSDPFAQLESVVSLVREVLAILGIGNESLGTPQLLTLPRIQSELTKFMNAPGFRKQAAAYELPNKSNLPLDIKLFWIKKASKSNLSWSVGVTSNYEDSPENYANKNIGIDFVIPEKADRVFVILSSKLRLRVLELHERLTHTQREIFTQWASLTKLESPDPLLLRENLHTRLWKSFDYEPVNREFYKELVERFDVLVEALTKQGTSDSDAKMFSVRLIGRLLFLWFLRKKEFLNPELHYFNAGEGMDQSEYYYSKLEPLFFEVLNAEMKDRTFADKITPFLNGGLFEPIAVDFHSKENKKFVFPKAFFANFYDRLDHYNFTVDEGTSEYEQVAIDPEMLGRVFENLLASLHTETGEQARKAKGAFYTPREIVDYMCAESLIEYLKAKLPDTENRDIRIRELVTMSESDFRGQDHNKRRDFEAALGRQATVDALNELRILDPAVGSGAFPMGMLQLLVKVYGRLDAKLEKNLSILKRDILSRSLYGVDIDQMAIQISRLRAWLSILVDMEELKKVAPLPNLDFKFVCANTLIPLPEESDTKAVVEYSTKEQLMEIRDAYYSATRKADKLKLRKNYLDSIRKSANNIFASSREENLSKYDPFNPLDSSPFYDSNLMHGIDAFDVVIGNPPYVNIRKLDKNFKGKYKESFVSATGQYDLYVLFIEKALSLSKKHSGLVSYITPNKFLISGYGNGIRKIIAEESCLLDFIDYSKERVFETASVYPVVFLLQNRACKRFDIKQEDYNLLRIFDLENIDPIISKLENINLKLGDICVIKEAIHTGNIREKLISKSRDGQNYYKLLRGKDCGRYLISWDSLYINYNYTPNKSIGEYANLIDKDFFLNEKLFLREIALVPTAVYDNEGFFSLNKAYVVSAKKPDINLKFINGVINSRLIAYFYSKKFGDIRVGGGYLQFKKQFTTQIPVVVNDESIQNISKLVTEIIKLKKQDPQVNTQTLETQIDHLVYQLYNLTPEEIEIIEKSV